MSRYIGYARRSTSTQELTLEAQREMLESACRARGLGWEIERFEEDTLSGKSLERPGLQRALDDCEAGRADGIIVARLDRLTRSVIDLGRLLQLAKRRRFNIVALDFGLDLETPQGELVANIIVSVGQWERRVIGQRTSDALRTLPRHRRNGRPVYADSVRTRARELRGQRLTLHAIAEALTAEGVRPVRGGSRLTASTVSRLLHD